MGTSTPAVAASAPDHAPAASTTALAATGPRLVVADEEEVPVLRHVHGDPVLLGEAQDHRDARSREADVDLARELPAAVRWNATEHPTIPAPITTTSADRGSSSSTPVPINPRRRGPPARPRGPRTPCRPTRTR